MVFAADLSERVTDDGLCALAMAGCGAELTALTLWGTLLVYLCIAGPVFHHLLPLCWIL